MTTYDLRTLADEQLEKARADNAGRSSVTLVHDGALRQTVIALREGRGLDEHNTNGNATAQVLRGRLTIRTDDAAVELHEGEVADVPQQRHSAHAETDTVFLLTVAMDEVPK